MIEFTRCPGECGGRVRVWDGTGINFCCHPCWKTYWEAATAGMNGGMVDPLDYGHSDQCQSRQKVRDAEPIVTGRDFQIMGKSRHEALRGLQDPD